jgi:hypothetical protein
LAPKVGGWTKRIELGFSWNSWALCLKVPTKAEQKKLHTTSHGTPELCAWRLHERPITKYFCLASNFRWPFMELPCFVLKGSMKGQTQKCFIQPPTFSTESWRPSKIIHLKLSQKLELPSLQLSKVKKFLKLVSLMQFLILV